MPVILMDDLVDSIKAGGKQPLCDLSIGSCGMTIGIILSSMTSVLILHYFSPIFQISQLFSELKKFRSFDIVWNSLNSSLYSISMLVS
jgi:hypothetical protein